MLRFGRDSRSAQPWLRPPRLRTLADIEEDRHASWLELFFDLVFVVAIAELSHELVVNHTLNGFATFAALFVPVFVAWQGFSFYADRFDTDDVFFRVCMLAAMLAVGALAIQIPGVAHGESSAGFALSYIAIRVLTVILNLRAYRHVPWHVLSSAATWRRSASASRCGPSR
jgi:low temperature requirement protein LtrA